MIFHPTVYWGDGAMHGFPHPDNARKTLTSRSTRKACEVIPDYAFFRKEDVLGAYFKRAGTRETRMHVLPDTPEFRTQIRSTKPISYLWHGEPHSHAWGGRRDCKTSFSQDIVGHGGKEGAIYPSRVGHYYRTHLLEYTIEDDQLLM